MKNSLNFKVTAKPEAFPWYFKKVINNDASFSTNNDWTAGTTPTTIHDHLNKLAHLIQNESTNVCTAAVTIFIIHDGQLKAFSNPIIEN